jgi:c-di-GMP-binding flagellar brake protein YcgR
MPIRMSASLTRLSSGSADTPLHGHTLDISAGGVRVTSEANLGMHDRVHLELSSASPEFELGVDARVIRITENKDGTRIYGLAFERLERKCEQRIVQLVFAEERRAVTQHANVRLQLWLPVIFRAPGIAEPVTARTYDLSADELRLVTRERLDLGTRLALRIEGDGGNFELETEATVVGIEDDGEADGRFMVTVEFDRFDRVTRSRILRFAIEEERRQEARRETEAA